MNLNDLHDLRMRELAAAREILDRADREKRKMTDDEDARWNAHHQEADRLLEKEAREVRQREQEDAHVDAAERAKEERRRRALECSPEVRKKQYDRVFDKFIRGGKLELTIEERKLLQTGFARVGQGETRGDIITSADDQGGYAVPEGFQAELEAKLRDFGDIFETDPRILRTDMGNDIKWPTIDESGISAEKHVQTDGSTAMSVANSGTWGEVRLISTTIDSQIHLVSIEMLEDAGINVQEELTTLLAERMASYLNTAACTGDGVGDPQGVTVGATDSTFDVSKGVWDAPETGTNAATMYEVMVDVEHALIRQHRRNAKWMFNDVIIKAFKKMAMNTNPQYPIWQAGMTPGAPNTVLGYPYVVNNSMPDYDTATNRCIVFGNFQKFVVRMVRDLRLVRFDEKYMNELQVGFVAFQRFDTRVIQPQAFVYADAAA